MMTILLPRSDALLVMAALRSYAKTCEDDVERRDAILIECLLAAHVAVARANEALDTKDK